MKRRALIATIFGIFAMGAAPRRHSPLVLDPEPPFPLPPIPPAIPPAFQAAPVPNYDLSAPAQAPQTGPKFSPDLFNQRAYNSGQGYTPGSTIERQQEQRQKPVPGINMTMPIQ